MDSRPIRALLVDDDEDAYVLTRDLLSEIEGTESDLDWSATFEEALKAIKENQYDVCLVDYRLGERSGLELMSEALRNGCKAPIILLTGEGNHEVDVEAMKAGAADYLVKGRIDASLLERSIRYAIEHKRARDELAADRERLAVTLCSVGDGLVATDARGMIVLINKAAARLTGWAREEAVGKPIEAVFRITGEVTGERSKGPVGHAFRANATVTFANHGVLISKDGTARKVAGSAAPIREESGDLVGAVLLFREIIERGTDRQRATKDVAPETLRAACRKLRLKGRLLSNAPRAAARLTPPPARDPKVLAVGKLCPSDVGPSEEPDPRTGVRGQSSRPESSPQSASAPQPIAAPPAGCLALKRGRLRFVSGGETATFTATRLKGPAEANRRLPTGRPVVLVADNDARARLIYRAKLEESGFAVAEAKDGVEAWDTIRSGVVQCVVMDVKMRGYHGIEILSRMMDSNLILPVVVVSAFHQLASEFVVATYPELQFFSKPVPPDQVAEAVVSLTGAGVVCKDG